MTQHSSGKPSFPPPSKPSEFEDLSNEMSHFSQTLFEGDEGLALPDSSPKPLQFRPPTSAIPSFQPPLPPSSSNPLAMLEDIGESTSLQPSTLAPPRPPTYVDVGESTALEAGLLAQSNPDVASSVAVRMLDPEAPPAASPPRPTSVAPVATSASHRSGPMIPMATSSSLRPPPPPPHPHHPFTPPSGATPSPFQPPSPPKTTGSFQPPSPQTTGSFQPPHPFSAQPTGHYASPNPYAPQTTGSFQPPTSPFAAPSGPFAAPSGPFAAPSSPFAAPSSPFTPMNPPSSPPPSLSFDDGNLHDDEDDDYPAERSEATVIDRSMLQAFQASLQNEEAADVGLAPLFSPGTEDLLSAPSSPSAPPSVSLFRSPSSLPDPMLSGIPTTQMPLAEGFDFATATLAEPVHSSEIAPQKSSKIIPLLVSVVTLLVLAIVGVLLYPMLTKSDDPDEPATIRGGSAVASLPPSTRLPALPVPPPPPSEPRSTPPSAPDASASPDAASSSPEPAKTLLSDAATSETDPLESGSPEPSAVAVQPPSRPQDTTEPSELPEELQPRRRTPPRRPDARPEPSRRTEPPSRRTSNRPPPRRRTVAASGTSSDLGITGAVVGISPPCQLYLDDQKLGAADNRLFPLKPGTHSFRCTNPSLFFSHSFKVSVTPGQISTYKRSFQKGSLLVDTKPWSSVYLKDFGKIGKSGESISLFEGKYNLLLYKKGTKISGPGYEQKLSVSILPGQAAKPPTIRFPVFDDED